MCEDKSIIIHNVRLTFIKTSAHILQVQNFQHSPLVFLCILSITGAQSSLCPQNKKFWAERQAMNAFPSVVGLW
jgi:hypothetical protein